jgi:oligopeptide/dipeptide ABC transporter ATP-binding protein
VTEPLLSVRDLVVRFQTREGQVYAVNGVSFDVRAGETVGLVGESGSGKSVTSLAIMGLLPRYSASIASGQIIFEGKDLTQLDISELRTLRGAEISMVFQDPMSSLNPVLTIGEQVVETIQAHAHVSPAAARERAVEILRSVGIPNAKEQLRRYPHQFSGGMRQRVLIAIALALEPRLLIADEPTTALDVTVQAQVLELLRELTTRLRTALVLISHDLGIMARMAQRVVVMYAGMVVESAPTAELLQRPRHPYTVGLLNSSPRLTGDRPRLQPIEGAPPDLEQPPTGCPFTPRCGWRLPHCATVTPPLVDTGGGHLLACHNPVDQAEVAAGRPLRSAPV